MIINRHNYEEFFLLYVDNELAYDDRVAVESFAEENPDLKEELVMLQQATLASGDIKFEQKEILYKNDSEITLQNYEEYLLLSIDNELSEKQATELEKFVLQHPQLQPEFTLLRKARLKAEVVEFKDKSKLYKREGRIISITWLRMSIAAAVIVIAALAWLFVEPDKTSHTDTVASTTQHEIGIQKNSSKIIKQDVTEKAVDALQQKIQKKELGPLATTGPKDKTVKTAFSDKIVKQPARVVPSVTTSNPENNSPAVALKEPVSEEETLLKTDIARVPEKNEVTAQDDEKFTTALVREDNQASNAVITTPAVYREVENNEEEKSLYIGSIELNKNKLRSLFKKATSLFDKKARNDDEKTLRIAGFSIKSK